MRDLISKNDTVYDVITKYPQLKEVLLKISEKFNRLNNPLLFNTVAKVTTIEKASRVTGVYIYELLYELNSAIGKGEEFLKKFKEEIPMLQREFFEKIQEEKKERPFWFDKKKNFKILDVRGIDEPFPLILKEADSLKEGEGFIVIQSFIPLPVIGYLESLGFEAYYEKEGDMVIVYFYKKEDRV